MRTAKWVGVSIAGALLSTGALAGYKISSEVTISSTTTGMTAMGAMGSARSSVDANQYIGCQVSTNNVSSGAVTVLCFARNAAGTYLSCVTTDPNYVSAAQGIDGDSYIRFSTESSGSNCTYLLVIDSSYYAPKQP